MTEEKEVIKNDMCMCDTSMFVWLLLWLFVFHIGSCCNKKIGEAGEVSNDGYDRRLGR